MVLAILLVLMVTLIGVTAVSDTVEGGYRALATNVASELVAAARAGVDAEVANLEAEAAGGISLTCLSGPGTIDSLGSGAANAASAEGYTLTYYAVDASASQAVQDLSGNGLVGPRYECSGTTPTPIIPVPVSSTWYLAIEAVGTTKAQVYYTAHPAIGVVRFSEGASSNFNDGMYGGEEIATPGDMVMTGSGATYTNGQLQCNSTNHYWAGDVWANGGVTSGDCQIHGNLYVSGAVEMTGCTAPDVTGGIFATGSVWMSGGCEVEGDIVSNGDVAFSGGADTLGNIYASGTDGNSSSLSETSLSSPLASSSAVASLPVEPLTVGMSAGATVVVAYNGQSERWNVSSRVLSGSTSIPVTLQTPSYAFPAGSIVETVGTPCGTSVCLQSGAGSGSSTEAANVYSANGTISVTNAPISGSEFGATPWPTCPVPGGSGVSCSGSALSALPVQLFPSLDYKASMWPSGTWTYYDDSGDTCTSNPNGVGLANAATYNEIENPPSSHVVIVTPCAIELDDAATGGQLTIKANMAIFAAGGFFFDNWNTPAVAGGGSCSSSSPCDVYFVVPCNSSCDNSGAGPFPTNGQGSTCPSSISSLDGDIWMQSGVDGRSLVSFFYTPNNFCAAGPVGTSGDPITGQIYVGGYVELSSQLFLNADVLLGQGIAGASSTYSASVVSVK